jgi:hypothetical protein
MLVNLTMLLGPKVRIPGRSVQVALYIHSFFFFFDFMCWASESVSVFARIVLCCVVCRCPSHCSFPAVCMPVAGGVGKSTKEPLRVLYIVLNARHKLNSVA